MLNETYIKYLDAMTEQIYNMTSGKEVKQIVIASDLPDNEVKQLVTFFNNYICSSNDINDFVHSLCLGNLDYSPPRGNINILNELKFLQSNLKHLTWKTEKIANGDFSQRVDFLGDFSIAFNSMVEQLDHAFQKIELQNTELKELNQRLYTMSIYDTLTNLYNRRYLLDIYGAEIDKTLHESDLSVSILDIDKFKNFNDTYGHQVGDYVLKETANLIKTGLRKDDVVARYGGEEFVIVLPNTKIDVAEKIIDQLRIDIASQNYHQDGVDLSVTSSFGVSCNSIDSPHCIHDIISDADIALYRAKETGRNKTVVFNPAMKIGGKVCL